MLVAYKFENNPFDPIEWCAVLIVIGNYLLIGIKSKLIYLVNQLLIIIWKY